jgi:hypothetical protein
MGDDVDRWQWINRERLADDQDVYLPPRAMDGLVRDYLDHHGDLARLFVYFATLDDNDAETAAMIREELHRHQLAIVLLAEWCEALEYRRLELKATDKCPRARRRARRAHSATT